MSNAGRITFIEENFEKLRRTIGLFLGPLLFIIILFLPIENLSTEGHRLAAILVLTIIYWICEPIPLPVTALFSAALCVIFQIADAKSILASFADPVVFLFLGSFLLAEAMMVHQLDRRIALTILSIKWVGNNTRRILFTFGAMACFLSMWLSNTATTAMLLPIGLGILYEMGELTHKKTGKPITLHSLKMSTGLMLMAAYAASVGGIGTPVGTPPNLIGIGMIHKLLGVQISFFQWMKFAIPMVILMYIILYFLILKLHPPEISQLEGLSDYLVDRKKELGQWTRGQINVLMAFLFAVFLWTFPGILSLLYGTESEITKSFTNIIPESIVALVAASILFLLPIDWPSRKFTITWKEATRIDWGTILLFGGGIALGSLTFSTGLAKVIGQFIIDITGVNSVSGITAVSIILGIIISETTSNTASANMIIPVTIAVAQSAGVNPIPPALGACLGASYGFMLPVSTPPNAIVYGSGMIPITQMVKTGIIFDVIGFFIIWGGIYLFTPLMGF